MFPLGNRCASINAGTLALIDAGIPMKDFVCACSATYLEDTPLLGEPGVSSIVRGGTGIKCWEEGGVRIFCSCIFSTLKYVHV